MRRLYVFILLLMSNGMLKAQSSAWPLIPNVFSTPSPVWSITTSMPGSYTTPYYASNYGYDINGNIAFLIKDGTVYNTVGTVVGNLTLGVGNNSKNIITIPDPGDCKANLVFHTSGDIIVGPGSCYHYTRLLCTRILTTGATPTIQPNYSSMTLSGNLSQCNLYNAITVSKPLANGNRYLYLVSDVAVYKYLVDGTGVTMISSYPLGGGVKPTDLELSPSGDKLAWSDANTNNGIRWMTLDAAGNFISYFQFSTTPSAYSSYGLEFINNNEVMVSAGNGALGGIFVADLSTSVSNLIINNASYARSQLEMGLYGRVYVATASSLVSIDAVSFSTMVASMPITSNSGYQIAGYYSLPKQLDGENYIQTFSCAPICPSSVTITGTYTTALTQSQSWITSSGTTVIPSAATVKLDADPVSGYVELNPGFETQAGATFIAEALDGCGAGVPARTAPANIPVTTTDDKKERAKDIANTSGLLVYPNPTGGKAVIRHSNKVKLLQVYNTTGKVVATINNPGNTITPIDLGSQPPGVYFIHADGKAAGRIVRE